MKKNKEGFVPVIIILLVLIGFVGVYFLGTLKPKSPAESPTPTPVSTTLTKPSPLSSTKPTSDVEQVKITVLDYLVLKGDKKENIIIDEPILLGKHKDKYSVGYKFKNDNTAHGGTYLIVGKLNGNWIIPTSGDSNYCNWIKTAELDEATQAFMGPSCNF